MPDPMLDSDIPAWWQRLGIPGLFDIHVHFMPEPLLDAVWQYFDDAGKHYGVEWPVYYRTPEAERLATLRSFGVRVFTALVYPHKPGIAQSLCEWGRAFAARTDGCLATGTFFPEPSAAGYVRAAIEQGTRVFKAHLQVGGYDPRDPLLHDVWGVLAESRTPVVVHCGSGPVPGAHTGPGPFAQVLAAHPTLTAVIAHCGAPDYDHHLDLVDRYPNVHVDMTMVGTEFAQRRAPLPAHVAARLVDRADRVLLGTDFPNIPYPYAHQLAVLERLAPDDAWLRAVCWENGVRLLGAASA